MKHKQKRMILSLLFFSAVASMNAQVTIGSDNAPSSFSVLELISGGNKGMLLPQLDSTQREALQATFGAEATGKAMGLTIFNTDTRCIETWNGVDWIQRCGESGPYVPPIVVIHPAKGGDDWADTPWVGAFWKDSQTGERIIASTNTVSVAWSASVDDPSGSGSWLTLAADGGTDPNLWTANPGAAENYQLPSARLTAVSGTGNILFRIGVTGTDSRTTSSAYKYPDGTNGKAPRYATITVTVNGINSKLYCRQGEAADYVFSPSDAATGTTATRPLAAKFSPYNLTAASLPASPSGIGYADISVQVGVRGGVFADYPTQAGAFWLWGTNKTRANYTNYIRRAYHPTLPSSGNVTNWDIDYIYPDSGDTWNEFTGSDRLETCPNGWRRPMVGDTTTIHASQAASGSELMQSLFSTTFDGVGGNNSNSTNYRYWGYYADGFFDRRPIVNAVGVNLVAKSAVSIATKDVAYKGMLFVNPATNASLFTPAVGSRGTDSMLGNAGNIGYYWSSSAYMDDSSWYFYVDSSYASQDFTRRSCGYAVRCVAE